MCLVFPVFAAKPMALQSFNNLIILNLHYPHKPTPDGWHSYRGNSGVEEQMTSKVEILL